MRSQTGFWANGLPRSGATARETARVYRLTEKLGNYYLQSHPVFTFEQVNDRVVKNVVIQRFCASFSA